MTPTAVLPGSQSSLLDSRPPVSTRFETPVGEMIAVTDDRGLHLLEFVDRTALPTEMKGIVRRFGPVESGATAISAQVGHELAEYFAGTRTRFTLPIIQRGTPFSELVWAALAQIPCGEMRSYGQLAGSIGRASAVRALARANGANQVAILVPCRRVIGADGTLVGYGGKLWRKRWLLDHERRVRTLF